MRILMVFLVCAQGFAFGNIFQIAMRDGMTGVQGLAVGLVTTLGLASIVVVANLK